MGSLKLQRYKLQMLGRQKVSFNAISLLGLWGEVCEKQSGLDDTLLPAFATNRHL